MAFNKYQVIKNALSYELANFIFNYFMLKRDATKYDCKKRRPTTKTFMERVLFRTC